MTYDAQKYHRRSIRLKGYDYAQAGAYFITVCVQDRACLFGEVVGDQMHLNDAGRNVLDEWNALPVRFPSVELDVVGAMPNHIHGIIVMDAGGVTRTGATSSVDTGPGRIERASVGATPVVALDRHASMVGEGESAVVARSRATTRVAPTQTSDQHAPGVGEGASAAVPRVGDVVGAFKSLTTVSYIHGVKHSGWPPFRGRLWQRNFHEHIIRNEESLNLIRQYIVNNPVNWAIDEENPLVERQVRKKA